MYEVRSSLTTFSFKGSCRNYIYYLDYYLKTSVENIPNANTDQSKGLGYNLCLPTEGSVVQKQLFLTGNIASAKFLRGQLFLQPHTRTGFGSQGLVTTG
jgi:hypothetical protein